MQKLKIWFKNNYLSIFSLLLLLAAALLFFFPLFPRLWISLKSFGINVAFYFADFFVDTKAPANVLDTIIANNGGVFETLLPIDFNIFKERLALTFNLLINKDVFNYWWSTIKQTLANGFNILILLFNIIIIIIFSIILNRKIKLKQINCADDLTPYLAVDKSRPLKVYERFLRSQLVESTRLFIIAQWRKLWTPKWFKIAFIALALFYTGALTILIDAIGNYFHLITFFDFSILWKAIVMGAIDLAPLFVHVPLFIQLIAFYIIIDKLRVRAGYNAHKQHEKKNAEIIENSGNAVMLTGASGSGKTALAVDMALTAEVAQRNKLLDICHEIQRKFYHYPWRALEVAIKPLKSINLINNDVDIFNFVRRQKRLFDETGTCPIMFDYDYRRYGLRRYDGLINESIFEAINDYLVAFDWYSLETSMILGNVSVSSSKTAESFKTLFSMFNPNFYKGGLIDLENRSSSVNFNWDWWRLGKKFETYAKSDTYVPTFGVFVFSEVGKERGSYESNQGKKVEDEQPNTKNDLLPVEQRIHRHKGSLRHRILFKEFFDEQRPEQLDPELRRVMETIFLIDKDKKKEKLALKGWRIERRFCEIVITAFSKYSDWRKQATSRQSLFYDFFNSAIGRINSYYSKRMNTFKFTEIEMSSTNGTIEKAAGLNSQEMQTTGKAKYYLSVKKDFAARYDSEYLKNLFNYEVANSGLNIRTVQRFKSYRPSYAELNDQRSYLFKQMKGILGIEKSDKKEAKK